MTVNETEVLRNLRRGNTIPVDNTNVEEVLDLLLNDMRRTNKHNFIGDLTAKELLEKAGRYSKKVKYHYINLAFQNTLEMLMLSIIMTTSEDRKKTIDKKDLTSPNGVFSYVYNFTAPDLSELGYTFYAEIDTGEIKRIG